MKACALGYMNHFILNAISCQLQYDSEDAFINSSFSCDCLQICYLLVMFSIAGLDIWELGGFEENDLHETSSLQCGVSYPVMHCHVKNATLGFMSLIWLQNSVNQSNQ